MNFIKSKCIKNFSRKLRQKKIKNPNLIHEKVTITGNATVEETSYNFKANEGNEGYNKNMMRIYDSGHDKYKKRKSVQEPENKNNSE